MKYLKLNENEYVLKFDKGDKVMKTLIKFAQKENITLAKFSGIGALVNPVVAFYDGEKYHNTELKQIYELLTCEGNITLKDNNPFPHIHVTLSDENEKAFGGHLIDGEVAYTIEMFLTKYDIKVERKFEESTKLFMMDLSK